MISLPKTKFKPKGFAPLFLLIVIALAAGVTFFLTQIVGKPARIKEKLEVAQPLFRDLDKSVKKVIDHLKEVPDSDADSTERYLQKGNSALKSAEDNVDTFKPIAGKLTFTELKAYKAQVDKYLSKTDESLKLEKDEMALLAGYISPLKDYEKMTVDLSGVSNYLYSDPARYVKEVGKAIDRESEIYSTLSALKPEGHTQKNHEAFLKVIKNEMDFLKQIKTAVENRNSSSVTAALKNYSENQQSSSREMNRLKDELNETIKDLSNDIDSLSEDIEREYSDLKSKFK